MEQFITFSQLNDFLYSPASLYLHSSYAAFAESTHKAQPQMYGKFRHETIDNGMYSTKACVISGKPVWSEELGIGGKIDIYDTQEQHLIERKAKLHRLHLGHLMQVYAQTAALREMGYPVSRISIHSLDDNKRYAIPLPTEYDMQRLADVVTQIRSTHTKDLLDTHVDAHGTQSIYGGLAW